jgi:hypothetical protein
VGRFAAATSGFLSADGGQHADSDRTSLLFGIGLEVSVLVDPVEDSTILPS